MKLLFELSGEHPDLPVAELECVGTVLDTRAQVAVAECPDPEAAGRLALTHVVMEYLGECEPTREAFVGLLRDLAVTTEKPFAGRAKKVQGSRMDASHLELERMIGGHIAGPVSLREPVEEYRVVASEDRCYFGRVLLRIDRGGFDFRNPMRRPFFHPGVMMPRMARALVNISLVAPGELVFDPFCGTGGILLEAREIGVRVLGSDFDPAMVAGYRQNLPGSEVMIADATAVPICDHTLDAVVTDLPYGQSVRIRAESMDRLYDGSLAEVRRILRPGRRAVVVTHRDITDIAARHFTILQEHEQRVHKSLTRRILVLS
ncbi:methyltransferase domain-containing protein [Methanoculleus sp. 7T]|uniref:methyltransferase domain-containing protein n=1 Tax=Methanoculleus sp. 7T TaxID=2937282 RepID=UPI0020BEE60E|nr:methyltransferase domain-containing protein [Methanoculleus sp. 7T]MCK8519823.1 methyltransferase domain-containing protein [Methanoculleus sp. 7T]